MAKHRTKAAEADLEAANGELAALAEHDEGQPPLHSQEDHGEQTKRRFQASRSWASRNLQDVRYEHSTEANLRLRDENGHTLKTGSHVFKFILPRGTYALPPEVREIMKANQKDYRDRPTGLIETDDRTLGKIWAVPDDPQGREVAGKITYALAQLDVKQREPSQEHERF